jgi:hypothetical protein
VNKVLEITKPTLSFIIKSINAFISSILSSLDSILNVLSNKILYLRDKKNEILQL